MDNTTVVRSSFWWVPFLRTLKSSPEFKRFCIGDDLGEYAEYLRRQMVVLEKGQFFYVVDRITKKLYAASGISLRDDMLYVHFYWAEKYRHENLPSIKSTLETVSKYYGPSCLRYVMFPVPIEVIGNWDGYAMRVSDDHKRRIIWYKFPYKDFCTFAQSIVTNQSMQFVA